MLKDTFDHLGDLGTSGQTDPFESIYFLVVQMTLRILDISEIASSPELLRKTLGYYHALHNGLSPVSMMVRAGSRFLIWRS